MRLREFHRRWGAWYEGKIALWTAEMLASKLGLNAEQQARLQRVVRAWQRLVWTAECLQHGGIYFGGRPEPLPRDEADAATLLVALADLLEPLLHSPELLRVLPKRADAFLYRRHATKALLDSISIRRERELAGIFATEIRERRHYTLDHIARVELGGRCGVERVTLAPEQRGTGDAFTGFVVEHRRGAIVGSIFLTESGSDWPAATYLEGFERALDETPLSYEELTAPLTKLAHTTVLTLISSLNARGLLTRAPEGRGYRYRPSKSREELLGEFSDRLIDRLLSDFGEIGVARLGLRLEQLDTDRKKRLERRRRRS